MENQGCLGPGNRESDRKCQKVTIFLLARAKNQKVKNGPGLPAVSDSRFPELVSGNGAKVRVIANRLFARAYKISQLLASRFLAASSLDQARADRLGSPAGGVLAGWKSSQRLPGTSLLRSREEPVASQGAVRWFWAD